ncbi:unnamed protein product [Sphenostylis stenocarpa]|uniref:Uncharacterized protein n=1 Tax=Sphenostylis stenocarpa TaxID=92480 RepID=A0AA86VQY9_9FABA|nr:unnamed protein product [Sphenostylis stenocarpa]
MNRRGGTSEVVDLIHLEENRFNDVVANELEPRVAEEVHQVLLSPGEEIVNDDDVVATRDELIDEMAPDEARAAGDNDPLPSAGDPDGDPAGAGAGESIEVRAGEEGPGLGWAYAGERGLDDKKSRADENPDEDEQKTLLSEEIVDGSGEGSGVFDGFGGVR